MSTLKSMTAYSRFAQSLGHYELVWELRSVNHRYLDAHFRLPETVGALEPKLKERLAEKVARGRVDIGLRIAESETQQQLRSLDREKLEQWRRWQQQVQEAIPDALPLGVMQIIRDGDVFEQLDPAQILNEVALLEGFSAALQGLLEQRQAEGGRMQQVLADKLSAISEILRGLQQNMPEHERAHQAAWQARVEKLSKAELDPLRLHQELALLISKADVTEELDRLQSHIEEFDHALQSDMPVGRRLDFLLQEFNREANTLGSKSIHQEITNASVELKVLIDQLREQVQNIE